MPSLENLTHAELKAFLADLLALQAAGQAAIEKGRRPSYCIAPGYDMGLTLAAIVPEACEAHDDLFREVPAQADRFREGPAAIAPLCAAPFTGYPGPYPESVPPSPPPEQTPADAPPAAIEGATGGAAEVATGPFTFVAGADPDHPNLEFQPAGALSSSPGEPAVPVVREAGNAAQSAGGGGGAEGQASPEPAAEPNSETETEIQTEAREKPLPDGQSPAEEGGGEAGSSPATVSNSIERSVSSSIERSMSGTNWTEEEEARLVQLVADAMVLGASKSAAIRAAAQGLGRPEAGTAFRCHHKLKARIDAAIAGIPAGQPAPEAAPAVPTGEGPGQERGDDPAEERVGTQDPPRGPAVAGAGPILQPALAEHLAGLDYRDGWTPDLDVDLLSLSILGWNLNEIAVHLEMRADLVKARFDLLTGSYRDANGKSARRFAREDVFAALEARLPQAAE